MRAEAVPVTRVVDCAAGAMVTMSVVDDDEAWATVVAWLGMTTPLVEAGG